MPKFLSHSDRKTSLSRALRSLMARSKVGSGRKLDQSMRKRSLTPFRGDPGDAFAPSEFATGGCAFASDCATDGGATEAVVALLDAFKEMVFESPKNLSATLAIRFPRRP